ncbi:MAG: hypothetical protein FWG57_02540 [Endomicrobia bacterium]|nr:hypothetical protein [Endomicrobiia bacterium]
MQNSKMDWTKDFPVASEILRQLGGGRALVMTGAKAIFDKDSLTLKLGAKYLRIRLNASDLYDISYASNPDNPITKEKDIFCENLIETCERMTGLYFKLF